MRCKDCDNYIVNDAGDDGYCYKTGKTILTRKDEHMDEKIKEFVKERNAALFSYDREKIRAFYEKYQIPYPKLDEPTFWGTVAMAICHIPSAPEDIVRFSRVILSILKLDK